jgi:mannose-6-phosphate isomerase-like protein (cupin superfamily)
MILRNVFEAKLEQVTAHEGTGKIQFYRPFNSDDFESPWHFVDYAIIPPGASVGLHPHGDNEEMYFILEGNAIMTVNDEEREVKPGDLILNRAGWRHGIRNEGVVDVKMLVVEVGIR